MKTAEEPAISSRLKFLLTGFLLIVITYAVYLGAEEHIALSGKVGYTIGYTEKLVILSSGRGVVYRYMVNEVTYENVVSYAYDAKVPGRYYVKFAISDPEINEIFLNRPAGNTIEPPVQGWNARPW